MKHSQSDYISLLAPTVGKNSFSMPLPPVPIIKFLFYANLAGRKLYLIVVLMCLSLPANEVEHLFML
jgi:hypothetical protein